MKLGAVVDYVRKAAGNGDPSAVSQSMAISYVSEAMAYVSKLLPSSFSSEFTASGYSITDPLVSFIHIRDVWVDNHRCEKIRWDEMSAMKDSAYFGGIYRYSCTTSEILISKKDGIAIVYGGFKPAAYVAGDLSDDLVQDASPSTGEVAGITDERLAMVRLRATRSACEEAGELDKAVYFMRAARRVYEDLRASYDPGPGDYTGRVEIWDGIQ